MPRPLRRSLRHESSEPKRFQQLALAPRENPSHLLAYTNHLEAVIRIGDHIDIRAHEIEDRKIIRRKIPDAT